LGFDDRGEFISQFMFVGTEGVAPPKKVLSSHATRPVQKFEHWWELPKET
jgi:hypothetical protein